MSTATGLLISILIIGFGGVGLAIYAVRHRDLDEGEETGLDQ